MPGKKNTVADALSRCSDHVPNEGEDATAITLPDKLFAHLIRPAALEESIRRQQRDLKYVPQLKEWVDKYDLQKRASYYWNGTALVAPDLESVSRALLEIYHDGPTAGHPGQAKTYQDL